MAERYRIDERLLKANAAAIEDGKAVKLNIQDVQTMSWRLVEAEVHKEPVEGAELAAILTLRHSLPRGTYYLKILRELSDEDLEGLEGSHHEFQGTVPLEG
ncbi:MAG TPA: hypothetical protein VJ256_05205 [Dehalococcoidia bacterium]|nr:hypothetical protein [Dehalococcoidia bacterium]HLB29500.1 hypothetical protein [Dehalococcoidia bacterium]